MTRPRVFYDPSHHLLGRYGEPFAIALQGAGYELVDDDTADTALIDGDCPWDPWQAVCDRHERIVLYPHGAGVLAWGAGQWERNPKTVAQLVTGPGHADIARRGGDVPAVVVGWPWTRLLPFHPAEHVGHIFMAPPHANRAGEWSTPELDGWRAAGTILTARFPDATWDISQQPHSLDETALSITRADIVATGSFTVLALAVALGRPAVFWGGPELFTDIGPGNAPLYPRADLLDMLLEVTRYPYGPDDVDAALATEATDWRDRFVGGAFDAQQLVATFEKLAG